jgi:DNA-binding transcriptional ArsR family regulator
MRKRQDPSEMFKVLGVGTRLRIIEILKARGPIGVTDIAERLGVTPAAVSQHLKLMRQAGLVTRERDGYHVPYALNEDGLDSCCGMLIDVCTCGDRDDGRPLDDGHGHERAARSSEDLHGLKMRKARLEKEIEKIDARIERMRDK